MNLKLLTPFVLFFILVLVFYVALQNTDTKEDIPSPLIGKQVPEFALPDLLGESLLNQQIFNDEPVLLNVWGSWCPSCYAEHDYLAFLAAEGVPIIGLNYKDKKKDALKFLKKLGNPYRAIIYDEKGSLGLDLGVYGAPETYLIDAQGQILVKRIGVMDERVWNKMFKERWNSLHGKPRQEAETGSE